MCGGFELSLMFGVEFGDCMVVGEEIFNVFYIRMLDM